MRIYICSLCLFEMCMCVCLGFVYLPVCLHLNESSKVSLMDTKHLCISQHELVVRGRNVGAVERRLL